VSHGKGARRSHPDKLAKAKLGDAHPVIRAALDATPPPSFSLDAWEPVRLDQGPTGSCTAHGAAGAVYTSTNHAGTPLGFLPSPRAIYAATRAEERAATAGPNATSLPDLTDSGAELADALAVLSGYGVCPMADPVEGRNSDVDQANVTEEPDVDALEDAAMTLVTGAYRIDPVAQNASDQIASAISSGFAIYTGFFVDTAFENLTPTQVAGAPNEADPQGGGHAVYLSGYRTNAMGAREFRLTNSWGAGWCDHGCCYVSEQWAQRAWEMWVIDVKVIRGAA
jgi:hypothetical protein